MVDFSDKNAMKLEISNKDVTKKTHILGKEKHTSKHFMSKIRKYLAWNNNENLGNLKTCEMHTKCVLRGKCTVLNEEGSKLMS